MASGAQLPRANCCLARPPALELRNLRCWAADRRREHALAGMASSSANSPAAVVHDSPAVVVDYDALCSNIRHHADRCRSLNMLTRPHIKTHKCVEIARLQRDLGGAIGITASKVDEAIVFMEHGFHDVVLAYPVVRAMKMHRLLRAAAAEGVDRLCCLVDCAAHVQVAAEAAQACSFPLDIMVQVDVGLGRCGIAPDANDKLLALCAGIATATHLTLRGLYSHAGHSYGAPGPDEIRAIAREERRIMLGLRLFLRQQHAPELGLPDSLVLSCGSTPTACLADDTCSVGLPPAYGQRVECTAGNYALLDYSAVARELLSEDGFRMAVYVVTTVVSVNDKHYICDAGSKTLSSDQGAHGSGSGGCGYGAVFYGDAGRVPCGPPQGFMAKLSEEHGWIAVGDWQGPALTVGATLSVVPNHSCPTVNLHDELVVVKAKTKEVVTWPVDARGGVH